MKILRRIWNNIKWLLNHPPISITQTKPDGRKCDYCNNTQGLWNCGGFSVCNVCIKKVLDKILKGASK